MKKILSVLATSLALALVSSCSPKGLNGEWKVESIDSVELGNVFNEATLEFNESRGEYYGVTGVNNLNGRFTVKGDNKIHFNDGPMTKMAADPHSMEVEAAYIHALECADNYEIIDRTLLLKDCCGNVVMTLSVK